MIYYVEDEVNIRELALYALKQAGLEAEGFPNAGPFRQALAERVPDLILLDIMLPGTDGLALLAELRRDTRYAHIPVMMLTAKGTEFDKVVGLDAGADDYLAKPFGMMELVSRCNALLRRAARVAANTSAPVDLLACGPIELDRDAREVRAGGVPVELTLKEFDLLTELMSNLGRVLSRAQLLERVWEITYVGETRTVDAHVQTLRHKLSVACPGAEECIQTVRGVGYRAKGPVENG